MLGVGVGVVGVVVRVVMVALELFVELYGPWGSNLVDADVFVGIDGCGRAEKESGDNDKVELEDLASGNEKDSTQERASQDGSCNVQDGIPGGQNKNPFVVADKRVRRVPHHLLLKILHPRTTTRKDSHPTCVGLGGMGGEESIGERWCEW